MLIIMQRKNRLPKYEMVLQSILHIKNYELLLFFLNKKKLWPEAKIYPFM